MLGHIVDRVMEEYILHGAYNAKDSHWETAKLNACQRTDNLHTTCSRYGSISPRTPIDVWTPCRFHPEADVRRPLC